MVISNPIDRNRVGCELCEEIIERDEKWKNRFGKSLLFAYSCLLS
jgi:hypothetical protein